jgi:hypothetical protein
VLLDKKKLIIKIRGILSQIDLFEFSYNLIILIINISKAKFKANFLVLNIQMFWLLPVSQTVDLPLKFSFVLLCVNPFLRTSTHPSSERGVVSCFRNYIELKTN